MIQGSSSSNNSTLLAIMASSSSLFHVGRSFPRGSFLQYTIYHAIKEEQEDEEEQHGVGQLDPCHVFPDPVADGDDASKSDR